METKAMFETKLCTLSDLPTDVRYVIPTYQRPYVWQEEQIGKLLHDIWDSFEVGAGKYYYVGTVITSLSDKDNDKTEFLVDGQQRFTTFWLIALAFRKKKVASKITDFLHLGDSGTLRLGFSIRDQVADYFEALLADTHLKKYENKAVEQDEYLHYIAKAVTTIENWLDKQIYPKEKTESFADYIYTKVQFVKNTAPKGTDLNKLFATLNDSGVQLEQTDILKANLLKHIRTDKILYAKIWEACEDMSNYFVRNVRQVFSQSNWASIGLESFQKHSQIFVFKGNEGKSDLPENEAVGKTLQEILKDSQAIDNFEESKKGKGDEETSDTDSEDTKYCRSIISFGQLLLHTYRIFLYEEKKEDFGKPFHVKHLLEIFEGLAGEEQITKFFHCLWRVRYAFDAHVVKWIEDDTKEERLMLVSISKDNKNYFTVTPKHEASEQSMLQSMLYFTANYNTQIWLTPYLYACLHGKSDLQTLETIDNKLSISVLMDKDTSFNLLNLAYEPKPAFDWQSYLGEAHGTHFRHYWFQKLEYVLWKCRKEWNRDEKKIENFRITSKNSVEHVFPRNHEFRDEKTGNKIIPQKVSDDFGNLALLSVSQNSSYSNQDVGKKAIDFQNKITYDSLKLARIYAHKSNMSDWSEADIIAHREEMIKLLCNHYSPKP